MALILSSWDPLTCQNWMHPLMRLMPFLQSFQVFYALLVIFLIILDCSLLLASNLINYGARQGFAFACTKPVKMSASKLIHYFSSHPAAFGFQASLPSDSITLNPASKSTGQSLSYFQPGIGAAAHATLDKEQLISHTRSTLLDTIASTGF